MVKKVNTRSPKFGEKLRKLIPGEKSWPDLNLKGGGFNFNSPVTYIKKQRSKEFLSFEINSVTFICFTQKWWKLDFMKSSSSFLPFRAFCVEGLQNSMMLVCPCLSVCLVSVTLRSGSSGSSASSTCDHPKSWSFLFFCCVFESCFVGFCFVLFRWLQMIEKIEDDLR